MFTIEKPIYQKTCQTASIHLTDHLF